MRAHDKNPWVMERLAALGDYYDPAPRFLIVDYGSEPNYSKLIRQQCQRQGLSYHFVDDPDIFSLSIARNEGASHAATDLLYFTDIDFVHTSDHFTRLANYANDHDFSIIRDIVLNLPAYHLTERYSEELFALQSEKRDKYINQLCVLAMESARGDVAEFIAPYSNNLFCTRDFFMMVGGYDSSFRGHGSEDFELMIRCAHHNQSATLPVKITLDCKSPARDAFRRQGPYEGFRRLGEAISFRAESAGFQALHLWHPSNKSDPWRVSNDWSRRKLKSVVKSYSAAACKFAQTDFIPRKRKALCICKDPEHYGYFVPFRILGYELLAIEDDSASEIDRARDLISTGQVDAFMIFNPYMRSHKGFFELFEMAKAKEIELVIAERGALPSTIYYASDVAYNDPDYVGYNNSMEIVNDNALKAADEICSHVRMGSWTLEKLKDYEQTTRSLDSLKGIDKPKVFVPLQLADDISVTKFIKAGQSYAEFEAAIDQAAARFPDIIFLVKSHPLSHQQFTSSYDNVICCMNDENVHAVIEACDYTVCYNSGVGLLSIIHGKPTVTVGNAYYNVTDTGHRADSLEGAVDLVESGECTPPVKEAVHKFIAWLVSTKYSFFKADDVIVRKRHRKSHAYKNIMVTHLNWQGTSLPLGRSSALGSIGRDSYTNGRLGLGIGAAPGQRAWSSRRRRRVFFQDYIQRPYHQLLRYLKTALSKEAS